MKDLNTTMAAFITAAAALIASFGYEVDPKYVTGIIAIGGAFVGFFAKDGAKKS